MKTFIDSMTLYDNQFQGDYPGQSIQLHQASVKLENIITMIRLIDSPIDSDLLHVCRKSMNRVFVFFLYLYLTGLGCNKVSMIFKLLLGYLLEASIFCVTKLPTVVTFERLEFTIAMSEFTFPFCEQGFLTKRSVSMPTIVVKEHCHHVMEIHACYSQH